MSEVISPNPEVTPGAGANEQPAAQPKSQEQAPAQKADASPTASAKPAEAKPDDTKAPETQPTVVPEKYDLKLPEGSLLDNSAIEKISTLAKEKGLSNDMAQVLLDQRNEAVATYVDTEQARLKQVNETQWVESIKSDPEIGGQNFEESGKIAYQGGVQLFGEAFIEKLISLNLNHEPALFKGLWKYGKQTANDRAVQPNQHAAGKMSDGELFYGKQNS